jgi:hypothetical protein
MNADNWTEEMASYSNSSSDGGEEGSFVLNIDWDKGQRPRLTLSCEAMNCESRSLRFDIADTDRAENGNYEALEADITLIDAEGSKAILALEKYALVLPPLPVYQGKAQHLLGDPAYKVLYRTVNIPVSSLRKRNKHWIQNA